MAIFSQKVILITGASEGIGRALALALIPHQPKLVLAARNKQRLTDLASECERGGAITCVLPTDVTDEQSCQHLMEQAVAEFGRIDVLINNAGISMWSSFEDVSDLSLYEYLMKINFLSSVYCTKYALPYLKKAKGQIIAVSSVAGLTGVPTRSGYAASKHAMIGFFESLRIELADSGVSVTIIAPDYVQSKIHERSLGAQGQEVGVTPANQSEYLTAEACADMIVKAMEKRQRLLMTSWRGYFGRLVRPMVPWVIDKIALKSVLDENRRPS